MELHELPDLSDWLLIEVWTIEEAAMLWAAVDPMEHVGVRLLDLKHVIKSIQYRKASAFQRAIAEAVCGGSLSFVEAWEEHYTSDYSYEKEIEFPDLPQHSSIIHYKTRINQAAFMKWAQSKKMWSMRQRLQRTPLNQIPSPYNKISDDENTLEMQVSGKTLVLAPPSYVDASHPLSPAELRAAHDAWVAVTQDGNPKSSGTAVRAAMLKFLNSHPEHSSLGSAAKERICTVANWDKKGGATRTPGGEK
jgi:hypothetical protein